MKDILIMSENGEFFMITLIDFYILNLIQRKMRCRLLDCIMPKISMMGNFGIVWIMLAVFFLMSTKYEDTGEKMICGLFWGVILGNLVLKHIFSRPRPFQVDKTKQLIIKTPKDHSFPSGHTVSSVISTCILMNANNMIGAMALLLCCMIIFSRMYLFVHYPSDILGGIILGVIISEEVIKFNF